MSYKPVPQDMDDSALPRELQNWLDGLDLNRLYTMNKDQTVEFIRARGTPVFKNAVVTAVNSGELTSSMISGQALISEHDAIRWILSRGRKGAKRRSA